MRRIIAPATNLLISKQLTKINRTTTNSVEVKLTKMVTAFLRTKQVRPIRSFIQRSWTKWWPTRKVAVTHTPWTAQEEAHSRSPRPQKWWNMTAAMRWIALSLTARQLRFWTIRTVLLMLTPILLRCNQQILSQIPHKWANSKSMPRHSSSLKIRWQQHSKSKMRVAQMLIKKTQRSK